MSSRDGSDRTGGRQRSSQSDRSANQRANWDVDPAEIDRYLSGRPSRQQEAQATSGRPQQRRGKAPEGTADQLEQLQRARGEQPRQPTPQPTSRPPSVGRQQFVEPVYEDEYDDAYDNAGNMAEPDPRYTDTYADEGYAPPPQAKRKQQPARRQSPPSRQQRPAQRRPVYEDEYDDELYADDPYLTYDETDDWRAPATRPTTRQRPQVRLSKPNLPKFSIPQSISQAELVNDIPSLAMIGGAIFSAAMMAIIVSNRLDVLPDIIPTHVSASGVQENLRGRNAMWSIPLLVSAVSLMNLAAAWFFSKIDMFAARFMLAAALVVQFIAWVAVLKYLWP